MILGAREYMTEYDTFGMFFFWGEGVSRLGNVRALEG